MSQYLQIHVDKIEVVRLGINLQLFQTARNEHPRADHEFTIGFLARISPEKGLHLLVKAFILLCRKLASSGESKLKIGGYLAAKDERYFNELKIEIQNAGLQERVSYTGELDRAGKLEFLRSIDVLCVPTVYQEPKGLFALEAMAAGIPVVLPRHGAFPEILDLAPGGILVEPGSESAVAEGLLVLMNDAATRQRLGSDGKSGVQQHFGAEHLAEAMESVYHRYIGSDF